MKRMLIIAIALVSFSVLSATNNQRTYYSSEAIWQRTDRLCRELGLLGPTPVSPATESEIRKTLNRIDISTLSSSQREEYRSILALMDESNGYSFLDDTIDFDPVIEINPEFYLFSNTKNTLREEFFLPYRDRKHFLDLGVRAGYKDGVYLEFRYPSMESARGFSIDSQGNTISGPYFYNFSNFAFLISPSYNGKWESIFGADASIHQRHYTMEFRPVKIIASAGTGYANFMIGRMRQRFGNGITGNMILGDTLTYQEAMRLSFFSNIFSYYMSFTHYDNAEDGQTSSFDRMHQQRSVHRFDFNIADKARIALNLGTHFTTKNAFDWRMLMPLMVNHNRYNFSESVDVGDGDEANNIIGLELEWAVCKGWRLGGEIAIDQFQPPTETGSSVPNSFGFLVNAKNTARLKKGSLDSYAEFVYTNPYLYLNNKRLNGNPCYYYDHIAGYSYWADNELNYLDHEAGPDAIVFSIGSEYYANNGKWNAGASVSYMIHGEKGKEDYRDKDVERHGGARTPTGVAEHTLRFDADTGYRVSKDLSFDAKAAAVLRWNYHNQEGEFRSDIQMSIGINWTII